MQFGPIGGVKFQRILLDEDIKQSIFFNYDLDICRNCFDGELYVYSWDNLINRQTMMYAKCKDVLGYAESDDDDNEEVIFFKDEGDTCFKNLNKFVEYFTNRAASRIENYQRRGFEVIQEDNFNELVREQYAESFNIILNYDY